MSAGDQSLTLHWMTLVDIYYKTISYAQNQEDILLSRAFREPKGFYIDIGANHPIFHSVTKLFSDRGWHGINVEPSPVVFASLASARPRDINLNIGVSDHEDTLTFYESLVHHGWSTFRLDLAEHYRQQGETMTEKPVPVMTLAKVCEQYVQGTIDFLKIDAEGFEREILLGSDFKRWRPRVLLIENSWPETWEPLIDGLDYRHAAFDGLNHYYVRSEDEHLIPCFSPLPNLTDNFISHQHFQLIEGLATQVNVLAARLQAASVAPEATLPVPEVASTLPEVPTSSSSHFLDILRHHAHPAVRQIGSAVRRLVGSTNMGR